MIPTQVLELLKSLIEVYEPYRMPPLYMADCVIMTHAVLRQLEGHSGPVLRKKKSKRKRKKVVAVAAGAHFEGEDYHAINAARGGDDEDVGGGEEEEDDGT